MMIGSWPCCGEMLMIALPDVPLPVMCKDECEHCKATVWHQFSRIEPKSWTEEDFLKEFVIDEKTKAIRDRTSSDNTLKEPETSPTDQ